MLAYNFLNNQKPDNKNRITMMLDKGLGINQLSDILETAGNYITYAKFGWGTSAVCDRELIRKKTAMYNEAGILPYPGGTLFEVSLLKGKFDAFLEESASLGFKAIEISDGSTLIPYETRRNVIKKAHDAGFTVLSEVGKKNPDKDHDLSISERLELIRSDLECGVSKVIIEARESGKNIGIYDSNGDLKTDSLDELIAGIGFENLIFEAPLKPQQVALLKRFGQNVNLGNIASDEVISLETLRRGLRGDTVENFL